MTLNLDMKFVTVINNQWVPDVPSWYIPPEKFCIVKQMQNYTSLFFDMFVLTEAQNEGTSFSNALLKWGYKCKLSITLCIKYVYT